MYNRIMTTQKVLKTVTTLLGIIGLFAAIIVAGIVDTGGSTHDLAIWGTLAMSTLIASIMLQSKIKQGE